MTSASIVIPSRAGARRLPRLMEALRAQTVTAWEAIVVLDGDIDGSGQVMATYADLPVRVITFPENRGRVAALNAGFEAATGDVLIRCDDDLEPRADYVERHIAAHAERPCGVVGLYRNVLDDNAYARAYGNATDGKFRDGAYDCSEDERWHYWAGNCSITREIWEAVGPYDTRYRTYGWEDADYGLRVYEAGYPIVLDPALETTHHAAAVTTDSRVRRAYHSGQARHLFDSIHGAGKPGPGPTRPTNTSAWNIATNVLADSLSYERACTLAAGLDRAPPRLPIAVSSKLIALLVEAAAVAGYAKPDGASNDV